MSAGGTGGKRILEIRVEEATGLNKEGARTWGSEITDGFVKGKESTAELQHAHSVFAVFDKCSYRHAS